MMKAEVQLLENHRQNSLRSMRGSNQQAHGHEAHCLSHGPSGFRARQINVGILSLQNPSRHIFTPIFYHGMSCPGTELCASSSLLPKQDDITFRPRRVWKAHGGAYAAPSVINIWPKSDRCASPGPVDRCQSRARWDRFLGRVQLWRTGHPSSTQCCAGYPGW